MLSDADAAIAIVSIVIVHAALIEEPALHDFLDGGIGSHLWCNCVDL